MENKRVFNLDIARIMAIILVIFIHVSSMYLTNLHSYWSIAIIYNEVSRVSVPMLFMI